MKNDLELLSQGVISRRFWVSQFLDLQKVGARFELANGGFADRSVTTSPTHRRFSQLVYQMVVAIGYGILLSSCCFSSTSEFLS